MLQLGTRCGGLRTTSRQGVLESPSRSQQWQRHPACTVTFRYNILEWAMANSENHGCARNDEYYDTSVVRLHAFAGNSTVYSSLSWRAEQNVPYQRVVRSLGIGEYKHLTRWRREVFWALLCWCPMIVDFTRDSN